MLEYKEFITLTDYEITFILTELFNPVNISNITRDSKWNIITADIETDGWNNGEELINIVDTVTLSPNDISVDFALTDEDLLKYRQYLLARGCNYLLKNNPYI